MNIEQLRKDMETGTTREFSGTNEQLANALMHIAERKSTGLTDTTICAEAADRIAQLERIALAAEALAEAINTSAEQVLDPIGAWSGSPLNRALAAYREATK